jgi:hypothetical protein
MRQPTRWNPDLSASEATIESDQCLRIKCHLISLSGIVLTHSVNCNIIHKT